MIVLYLFLVSWRNSTDIVSCGVNMYILLQFHVDFIIYIISLKVL